MKVTSCYNCGSADRSPYATENGFSLVKCAQCGLLYVEDRPDDTKISEAHKQGKHSGTKELDHTGAFDTSKIPWYLEVLNDMYAQEHSHVKTWLDVGCGHGEFVSAIQDYSDNTIAVTGSEPNVHKQKSGKDRGLDIGYFDLETHEQKYDCVSLLNVYSHIPDPPAFLASLKKLINPGGELVIETGDTAHLDAKDHYRPLYLPDHLSFTSEKIVVDILERLGFEVVSVHKYPFMNLSTVQILKETVKAVLPNYTSSLPYWFKRRLYTQTDMFIRARLKPTG